MIEKQQQEGAQATEIGSATGWGVRVEGSAETRLNPTSLRQGKNGLVGRAHSSSSQDTGDVLHRLAHDLFSGGGR